MPLFTKTPQRSDTQLNIDAWKNMHFNIEKALNVSFDPSIFSVIEDSTGTYVTMTPSSTEIVKDPWQIFVSPTSGLPVDSAWRTIQVHSGTLNSMHPVKNLTDTFSDDTEPVNTNKDIVLEASKKYFICVYQNYDTTSWNISGTSIFIKEDDGTTDPSNYPFVGWPGNHNIYRNVLYYQIGRVTTSDDTTKRLTITEQTLDKNFEQGVVVPDHWEPVATTTNFISPGSDDWRKFKIFVPGTVDPEITVTDIGNTFTLTADDTNFFYIKYTLNQTTGDVTAMQLYCDTSIPTPSTPAPGLAPEWINRQIASIQVPSTPGSVIPGMNVPGSVLSYATIIIGYDINSSNDLVELKAGKFG